MPTSSFPAPSTSAVSPTASSSKAVALPPLRNPPLLEAQEDLANLSNLNEPSVLHAIRTRYDMHLPYTYSGCVLSLAFPFRSGARRLSAVAPCAAAVGDVQTCLLTPTWTFLAPLPSIVLIAINPFYPLSIYGQDMIQSYAFRKKGELEPHLFAIAEEALDCLRRGQTAGGEVGSASADQTIVVSGESGAGKTVSAKYILRYFASVDDPSRPTRRQRLKQGQQQQQSSAGGSTAVSAGGDEAGMSEVERQMLATNPIMEAFGNAKTTRNDNSSRFGKYMEVRRFHPPPSSPSHPPPIGPS